nr:MAG TPA: hypothetical protein [Caudoviricetes sp.]
MFPFFRCAGIAIHPLHLPSFKCGMTVAWLL